MPASGLPPVVRRWAPIAVALSLLSLAAILVVSHGRRDVDVLATLRDLPIWTVPAALGLHILAHSAWSARIALLAGGLGIPLRPMAAMRLVLAGQFGAAVTPARVGAEATRMALLVRGHTGAVQAGRTVLADRASDLLFFVAFGTAAAFLLPSVFGPEAVVLRGLAFAAAAALLGFILLLLGGLLAPRRTAALCGRLVRPVLRLARRQADVRGHVLRFLQGVRDGLVALLRERPLRLLAAFGITLVLWTAEFGVLAVLLHAVGSTAPLTAVFAAGVLLTMLSALPLSAGGAGVAEFSALLLLGAWAGPAAPVVVLLWRATTYYYDIAIGGAVAAWSIPVGRPLVRPA